MGVSGRVRGGYHERQRVRYDSAATRFGGFVPCNQETACHEGVRSDRRRGEFLRSALRCRGSRADPVPDGSGYRVYASGIRKPVGLTLQPGTDIVWTAVNERDRLGDDLVPDYATSLTDGGFYGWPYSCIGQNYDPRYVGASPELVERALVPDVLIPAHSAALGIAFYTGGGFRRSIATAPSSPFTVRGTDRMLGPSRGRDRDARRQPPDL